MDDSMDQGKYCPRCKEAVGIWPVFKAPWPTMIKCPTCRSKLAYDFPIWRMFFTLFLPASLLLAFLSAGTTYLVYKKSGLMPIIFALTLFVILWSLFELANTAYWRKNKKLKILKSPDPWP